MINIGILAIQGAFIEHKNVLETIENINIFLIKTKNDIQNIDGLIIPGGESTVMKKFILQWDLYETLNKFINIDKKPVFGTCAGSILLSNKVKTNNVIENGLFQSVNIEILRNGYGRQNASYIEKINIEKIGVIDAIYIRAPIIKNLDNNCKILAYDKYNNPTLLKYHNILLCTFHPELTMNLIHKYFITNYFFFF